MDLLFCANCALFLFICLFISYFNPRHPHKIWNNNIRFNNNNSSIIRGKFFAKCFKKQKKLSTNCAYYVYNICPNIKYRVFKFSCNTRPNIWLPRINTNLHDFEKIGDSPLFSHFCRILSFFYLFKSLHFKKWYSKI